MDPARSLEGFLPLPPGQLSDWARASYSNGETWLLNATALDQNWGMFAPTRCASRKI